MKLSMLTSRSVNRIQGNILINGKCSSSLHCCRVYRAFIKKFADDTKCYQLVITEEDKGRFQAMLDNLNNWNKDWQMMFNMDKCHVIHVGKKDPELNE